MSKVIAVIIPCYNEVGTIRQLLEAIEAQTISAEHLEIVIADGMSTDGTREALQSYRAEHPRLSIKIVDNVMRTIPAALNVALRSTSCEVVIRLDAHSMPASDYCQKCLELLSSTGAANVGGVWELRPSGSGWIARAIARAAAHPLGAGDARYRLGGAPGEVETVPFGAYRREWLDLVGPFNENLLTNEDYEYNVRLKQAGGRIWFDPSIRSVYYARPTLGALLRQYARYGFWKAQMARRYPRSLRWRQILPPTLILAVVLLSGAGFWWKPAWTMLLMLLALYAASVVLAAIVGAWRRKDWGEAVAFPLAIWIMHLSWGSSFLVGLVRSPKAVGDDLGG